MVNKNHFVSLEVARKLKDAGMFPKSHMVLEDQGPLGDDVEDWRLVRRIDVIWGERLPAPNLSEILDELSARDKDRYCSIGECCESPEVEFDQNKQYVCEIWGDCELEPVFAKTLIDASALMLLKIRGNEDATTK